MDFMLYFCSVVSEPTNFCGEIVSDEVTITLRIYSLLDRVIYTGL